MGEYLWDKILHAIISAAVVLCIGGIVAVSLVAWLRGW